MIRKDKTAVYKHIGLDGNVLYVGLTNYMPRRLKEHDKTSYWYDDVKSIEIEWFETRDDAVRYEQEMIRMLSPEHNIHHNSDGEGEKDRHLSKTGVDYIVSSKDIMYFLAFASCLSSCNAAKILDVSQPSVSIAIKRVEQKVGVRIVKNSGVGRAQGRAELTDFGIEFHAMLLEIDASYRKMLDRITQERANSI